jgi:glycosyltransferase involved in cell wall biosynthesis
MGRVELSLVLPAYNEEESIEDSLSLLERAIRAAGISYEVVVVDDGSLDETALRAVNYASRNGHVQVVTYRQNVGKGYAVRTGFARACGDAVAFVDSDLDINFRQLPSFVKALRYGDIVIASKRHPESAVDVPLIRRVLSSGFNVLVRLLTGVSVGDTQTGLKAIRRSALVKILPRLSVKRHAFDVELLAVAHLMGLRVIEMPVNVRLRGLFRLREIWWMFFDLLGITYRLRVLRWYQRFLKQSSL